MPPLALRPLEFDRIVEVVRGFATTPMGHERLARLIPSTEAHAVSQLLGATSETRRYLDAQGDLPLRASSDLPQILGALAFEGRALEPLRLLALTDFLESVEEAKTAIRRTAGAFPRLESVSGGAASFRGEIAQTRQRIAPSGEVVDEASAELKMIRDRLRKQRSRLRGTLESYLRGRETAKYLQEQVVTERGGRYVLVVKSEHRASIPGIVHGTSTSGASLFLEPLSTVEINNDIVALEEQEAEEIRRILLALSASFRARAADMHRTIESATELDVLQARARFSDLVAGVEPTLSTDGAFELLAARHPLLMPEVVARLEGAAPTASIGAESKKGAAVASPVPVTIRILPPATVLLVTGPNTGGKTVALKTAGLLAMMAQAGLHIPAAHQSRLPVFRSVFADIGDEQSIEASLSTFSAHITNIAAMDRGLAPPALVLLDEVGSGTDPVEGGALGVAIVDHLRRRGATIVATSHYDVLKTYASTTEGVTCAAFGFDVETYAPTYQLVYGTPGRSLALEIAARLGLSSLVIDAARQHLSVRETQLAEHLAKVDRDLRALEHEQRLATRERETLEAAAVRMRDREDALRHREETFQRRLNEELESRVREARQDIDAVVTKLKQRAQAMAQDAARRVPTTGEIGDVRREARAAVEAVVRRVTDTTGTLASSETPGRPPTVGDRVALAGLGLEGVVTTLHDDSADVDVHGKRMRASLNDLRVVGAKPAAPRVNVNVALQPRDSVPADLNVVGCTVDEAIARAERFLDESLLGDLRVVRLIHGYGTGQLRRALAGFLQQHPLVIRFAAAPPEQGGGGVTIVELKE